MTYNHLIEKVVAMDLTEIGRAVKEARRARKWSQPTLAEKSGVSLARIEALENGRAAEIGFKKLVRILHILALDLRITSLNQKRPTLDDLLADSDATK